MQQSRESGRVDETRDSLDERKLLLSHRAGDADAFAQLVQAYRAPVYSYLARSGVGESDRDDLFQEIFIRIHHAAPRYEADRPLHPWLFTIVANAVRTHLRRQRVRALVFREPVEDEPRSTAPDSERIAVARQAQRWLERQIQKLPLTQREVILLACVERRPQQEVAFTLGLPLNTVKTHLRRARMTLAERWRSQRGVS